MKRPEKKKILFGLLLTCLLVILAAHPLINYFGARYINHKLKDGVENYTGSIEKLRVNLFTGSYRIYDLILKKKSHPTPPFLDIKEITFSLSWRALFKGELRGVVDIDQSKINVVDNEAKEQSQNGLDGSGWLPTADALFPLNIEEIKFRNLDLTIKSGDIPETFGVLRKLKGEIRNITNVVTPNDDQFAQVHMNGQVGQSGELVFSGRVDFITEKHKFNIDTTINNNNLPEFNDLLMHYTGIDTKKGEFYLGVHVESDGETISGKVKPVLKDLDLLYKRDGPQGLGRVLKQHALALGNTIFTNDETNQTATIIEFSKKRSDIQIDNWQAFVALFENAFIESLDETIPH